MGWIEEAGDATRRLCSYQDRGREGRNRTVHVRMGWEGATDMRESAEVHARQADYSWIWGESHRRNKVRKYFIVQNRNKNSTSGAEDRNGFM